jgi:hypothetical protein
VPYQSASGYYRILGGEGPREDRSVANLCVDCFVFPSCFVSWFLFK